MNFVGPNRGRLLYSQATDALLQPNPPPSVKSQRPNGLGKHSQHCVLYPRYFGFGLFTVKRTTRSVLSQPRFHVRFVT